MPRKSRFVSLVLLLVASVLFAKLRSDDPGRLLAEGRELLAASKPAEAAEVLGRVGGDVRGDETAKEAAVLRVLALVQAKQADAAAKAAGDLLGVLGDDDAWRGRLESLLAKAAEQKGDVKAAAAREAELAGRTLSDPEQARLAGVYFGWAERLGKGEPAPDAVRPAIPPDHARAIDAYRRGMAVLAPAADRTTYRMACARHALALNDGGQAVQWATEALEAWKPPAPNATGTRPAATPAWAAEAYLRKAEGALLVGDVPGARGALRTLLALPSADETGFAPAAWILLGRTFVGDGAVGALAQAKDAFATYLRRWPDGVDGPRVRRLIAEACLAVGAYEESLTALAEMAGRPDAPGDDRAWARMRRAETLRALRRFDEAKAALQEFLAQHPSHRDVPAAQRMLPSLVLDKAKAALEDKRREDALKAYAEFVLAYPLDDRAPQVSLEIGHELRRAEQFDRARDAYRDARERWRTAKADVAAFAGLRLAIVEEEDRRDLEAAAIGYQAVVKEFAGQQAAGEAAQRLAKLEAVELALVSPRIFGAHEQATVELALRNIKETQLRVYRLDAAGYFERKGSLNGAEALDVALVKSDHAWMHATPSYARYRAEKLTVALKVGEGALPEGAYLVAAEAERRRAVVVVIVSKTRLVVKQAPSEIFAWAVDAASGGPLAGVEVLVRGKGLKTSAKTGEDGVVRIPIKPEHGACEVLGRLGASAVPGLAVPPSSAVREQLQARAHWTFDRPIYRPGDDVRFAAFVRDVENGAFVTPDGAPFEVAWVDPRGRTFATASLKTAAFGQVDGKFLLPADGALGDWTLRATLRPRTPAAKDFAATVTVADYRKPEYKVAVQAKSSNVRPGDKVEANLSVEAFFGGSPQQVDFQWRVFRRNATFDASRYREQAWLYRATEKTKEAAPDATWNYVTQGAGATDERGAADFAFETLNVTEPQQYMIQATVVDASKQRATGSGSAFAAWTPGNVVVLPDRRAYRAGDRLTAKVIGVGWNGAPLALKGRVDLLLVRQEGGKTIEDPLGTATVDLGVGGETDCRLDVPRGGKVIVRFTGEDAAGLKVVGEASAEVAGERPDLAKEAKIVFEKEVYRAGEKAKLFVQVPRVPAFGLLSFEAETVLMHRVVTLTEKSTTLEIELPELLAPNCTATWASMQDSGLLTSEDPVAVLRHLEIEVKSSAATAKPGDKITLTVTTKDQAGRPQSAAVALAVADAALDGLGGVGTQDPRFVFNRDLRPHLVRTGSSFAFRQGMEARPLDADLIALDEAAKKESEAERFSEAAQRKYAAADHAGAPPAGDPATGEDLQKDLSDRDAAPSEMAPGIGGGGTGGGAFAGRSGGVKRMRAAGAAAAPAPTPAGKPGGRSESKEKRRLADKSDLSAEESLEESSKNETDHNEAFDRLSAIDPAGGGKDLPALRHTLGLMREQRAGNDSPIVALSAAYGLASAPSFSWGSATFAFGASPFQPAPVETREHLADVAQWSPTVVTDAAGTATVEVTLPDNLTVWNATAAGVDRGTAAGLGSATVKVRKDVFVRLSVPPFATTGDVVSAIVLGRAPTGPTTRMKLTLRAEDARYATVEGATEIERETTSGSAVFTTQIRATGAGFADLRAEVLTAAASDGLKKAMRIVPFGEPWRFVERRMMQDRVATTFTIPAGAVPGTVQARVLVQAGLASELLEGLVFLRGFPHASLDAILDRVAVAAILHRAFVDAGLPSPVAEKDLQGAIDRLWTTMRGYQNDDGGFGPWPGRPSEPEATAYALEALNIFREAGYVIGGDLLNSAVAGAGQMLATARVSRDQRAGLAAALTRAGQDRGADLNALYRERDLLSTPALARLLRAAGVAQRGALTGDLLETLRSRRKPADAAAPFVGVPRDPWQGDDQETTALVLLAYQAADARADEQEALVKALRLVQSRRGCVHVRAVTATALALAKHVRGTGAVDVAGTVTVTIDGKALPAVKLDGAAPRAVIEIDPALLSAGGRSITVERTGGGEADVRVIASAVKAADDVLPDDGFFTIDRRATAYVDPDVPETKFAEGYSIVDEAKRPPYVPADPLAQAVAGTRATVRLAVRARDDAAYVVVEDPLPAGFDVVEAGVRGSFARFERREDRMVFVFDRLKKGETTVVTYPVYASLPGRYRARPAEAFELFAPEYHGRSGSYRFEVVEDARLMARIAVPAPTPDARLGAARKAFGEGRFAAVLELVGGLAKEFPLVDAAHDETLSLVQRAALKLSRHAEAVAARDALLQRNPGAGALPTDDVLRLGASYAAVGDPERARDQFAYVLDRGFGVEMEVADFLDQLGRPEDAALWRAQTFRRYPAKGGVPEAEFQHAGRWLSLPDRTQTVASARPLQGRRWSDALVGFHRVAAWHAGSELAERAGLERLRIFAALGLPARLQEEARTYSGRYPDAVRRDEALASEAEAAFTLGKLAEAKGPAEAVRKSLFRNQKGGDLVRKSDYAGPMAYLLGKIAHVEGRLDEAVLLYGEAAASVPDAAESHRFFTEKELSADAVVRLAPGKEATLPIRVKNVAKVSVQVYPVDLGVLFATRKSFDALNRADLSGITPAFAREFETGQKAYAAGTFALPLGAAAGAELKTGAYLAVVTDGERTVSTVVLASDLQLTTQRGTDGQLRCYLIDGKGLPVAKARVTVGQDGAVWYAGETDERGMLLAPLRSGGKATVVAESGDRYAAAEK